VLAAEHLLRDDNTLPILGKGRVDPRVFSDAHSSGGKFTWLKFLWKVCVHLAKFGVEISDRVSIQTWQLQRMLVT
tara:strand:+ start:273 stop:497 length:225 start_codon:yes stop_codon:yes gene_type:complete